MKMESIDSGKNALKRCLIFNALLPRMLLDCPKVAICLLSPSAIFEFKFEFLTLIGLNLN